MISDGPRSPAGPRRLTWRMAWLLILLALTCAGSMRILVDDHLRARRSSESIREQAAFAPLRGRLRGTERIDLLMDGSSPERARKAFGAQLALTPTIVVPLGWPPGRRALGRFLRGHPILVHVTAAENWKRVETSMRELARSTSRELVIEHPAPRVALVRLVR